MKKFVLLGLWKTRFISPKLNEKFSKTICALIADDLGVTVNEVRTNSTNLKQGMIVSVHGTYYTVTFNADFTSFRYDRTHLMSRDVQIVDKED